MSQCHTSNTGIRSWEGRDTGNKGGVKDRVVKTLRVKSGSSGALPKGIESLTPVLAAPHCREGARWDQARDNFCSQAPGSVPPPSPLSHPVGSRGTGLAWLGLSYPLPNGPETGEAGCFQKWPHLTLDTLPSTYFKRLAPHQRHS